MEEEYKPDKKLMKDAMGKMITQSLFLELGYRDSAIYTLDDHDKEYKGKTYPSLKKLYLQIEDPHELEFSRAYLLGWKHWNRMLENKLIRGHIDEWRDELEVQIRSSGLQAILERVANGEAGFQDAKFLVDRGWDKRAVGRPTRDMANRERKIQDEMTRLFEEDNKRMEEIKALN